MTIRTGNGDEGDTRLGSKSYRKGHLLVQYSAALDSAQSASTALPLGWGRYEPQELLQQLLYVLGAVLGAKKPREHELALQELGILMENQLEYISSSLDPLHNFIRVSDATTQLNDLRTRIREAEIHCVAAHDQLELESRELNENILYMLKQSMKVLNIASDWVLAFIWAYSTDEQGKVASALILEPWSEEKIRSLNV